MKEYLFVIWDVSNDTYKFVKVTASDICEAKKKFAKAFCPYLDFDFNDVENMIENEDVRIYYSEYKDIINLL